jgi:hypothetical protein
MDIITQNNLSPENVLHDQQPDYEKAEMDLLRDALKRTYKERFLMATRLYKIHLTLNKAIITHRPYTLDK